MLQGELRVRVSGGVRIGLAFFISAISLLAGCSEAKKPLAEAPPSPVPPVIVQAEQPRQVATLPPPQMNDVQQAVKRVFKEAVLIDTQRRPTFIVGDFNGDLSEDLAVVLKPATDKLSELNEEYPSWMLRDLTEPSQPGKPGSPRLRVGADDELLAIIHGYEAQGWRDPQATQTYLLKNAAGSSMKTHTKKEFVTAHQGRKLPQLRGDVLGEERRGKSGYLYFASSTYSWYDPNTFTGDPEPTVVHMRPNKQIKK